MKVRMVRKSNEAIIQMLRGIRHGLSLLLVGVGVLKGKTLIIPAQS
jgi:hypothetical protein